MREGELNYRRGRGEEDERKWVVRGRVGVIRKKKNMFD